MFNRSKFNNARFNLPAGDGTDSFNIRLFFKENIKNMTESAIEINERFNFNEQINQSTVLTLGMPYTFNVKEEIKGRSTVSIAIVIKSLFKGVIGSDVQAAKNINEKFEFSDLINSKAEAGKDIEIPAILLFENINNKSVAALEMYLKNHFTEILNSKIAGNITEYEHAIFNVELKPGEELEINSDLFTAYINDKNVLDLQEGSWVYFDADSRELIIDTGSGGKIEGKLLYREGWL